MSGARSGSSSSLDAGRPTWKTQVAGQRELVDAREPLLVPAEASGSERALLEPAPVEEWTVAVVGHVVDENGAPIEGAQLQTDDGIVRANPDRHGNLRALPDASSPWPRGQFGRLTTLHVSASASGSKQILMWVENGATLHLGRIVLGPGGDIHGTVRDQAGRPVANIRVSLYDARHWSREEGMPRFELHSSRSFQETQTDSEGSYRLRGVPEGELFVKAWWFEWEPTWTQPFTLHAGELARRDLTLEPSRIRWIPWSVQVLDPHGVPVPRSVVGIPDTVVALPMRQETDASGRAEFRLPDLGLELRVEAHDLDERWRSSLESVRITEQERPHQLVLREPSHLTLLVKDGAQRPMPGSRITVFEDADPRTDPRILLAGAEGTVRILLPAKPFRIRCVTPGFENQNLALDPDTLNPEDPIVLSLLPGPAVGGRVLIGGKPVTNAAIVLRRRLGPGRVNCTIGLTSKQPILLTSACTDARGMTDATGAFLLNVSEDGWYSVVVEANGFPVQAFGPFQVRGEPSLGNELSLLREGAIEGRLVLPSGESPAGRVVGACGSSGCLITTTVDEDGRFRIEDLAPGDYQVRVCKPPIAKVQPILRTMEESGEDYGYERIVVDCVVREGATTHHDLDLSDGRATVLSR